MADPSPAGEHTSSAASLGASLAFEYDDAVQLPCGLPRALSLEPLDLGERIRDVVQGPDGALYLLTDNVEGRIVRVVPATTRK